jgi:aminoglycoside phosphotransferase (APT) family kinase protein
VTPIPGLDLDRAGDLLIEAGAGRLTGPLDAEVISGGRSNLTYLVRGRTGCVVLRRPPLGLVLPSAHDMAREYRVTSALADAGFPVARPLLLCADEDVIGAPFYVMEYVDGVVLRDEALRDVPPGAAARYGEVLVDTLLRLHAIDYAAIGLAEFGRPDGYLLRQVNRWHRQWESSRTRELPMLEQVTERLLAAVPRSGRPGIVHGDYRLDNVMFQHDGQAHEGQAHEGQVIAAVMDWEMATIGDPLADVGLLVVYSDRNGPRLAQRVPDGFPTGAQLAERYARGSGVPLGNLDWYIAFGYFKLAVISEGIHARYLRGKTVGEGFEAFGPTVPILIEQAHTVLHRG